MSARAAVIARRAPLRIASALRGAFEALVPSPRARRRLWALLALAAVLFAGYMLWLRDSSLVKVERVSVTGLETSDAKRVRAALASAARSMTTLHVDHERLQQAVGGYPVVRELRVDADLPHALNIEVVQHNPAAIAVAGGSRVAVAGDGTVLRGVTVEGSLPELRVSGALPPERIRDPHALRLARVAGGAPAPLRRRLEDVRTSGSRGVVVRMKDGPLLIFGAATRVRAKWAAATRVLADSSSKGATYIDLRLPERPAAGGVALPAPTEPDVAAQPEAVAPVPEPTPAAPEPTATAPVAPEPTQPAIPAAPAQPAPQATPRPTLNHESRIGRLSTYARVLRERIVAKRIDTVAEKHLQCRTSGGRPVSRNPP